MVGVRVPMIHLSFGVRIEVRPKKDSLFYVKRERESQVVQNYPRQEHNIKHSSTFTTPKNTHLEWRFIRNYGRSIV